jgi:tetratricopeptide (TPR) repeat protein
MNFSMDEVPRTLKWKDGDGRRARWRIIGLAASFCLVCLVELIPTGGCAGEPGSLAEADQDFQKAMQIWGNGGSLQAEALLKRALAIRQERLGPNDPAIAQVIERLGVISFNRGRYAEAEGQFRRALNIDLAALGERNIATAYVMGDLGAALREQHRCRDAQTIVEHSLALYQELLPPSHPLVATRLRAVPGSFDSR